MNRNRQMEVHYINTGYPYTTTESFMDFFEGLTHVPINYAQPHKCMSRKRIQESTIIDVQSEGDSVTGLHAIPEECTPNHQTASSSQVVWQDGIDPDNMTYEELLDLGETVGTQSQGLSQELIELLLLSNYKSHGFFIRKRSWERCVICQMRYKSGARQTKLPCSHVYHSGCITKWLTINKVFSVPL